MSLQQIYLFPFSNIPNMYYTSIRSCINLSILGVEGDGADLGLDLGWGGVKGEGLLLWVELVEFDVVEGVAGDETVAGEFGDAGGVYAGAV